jgi:uncharacterized membrane protein
MTAATSAAAAPPSRRATSATGSSTPPGRIPSLDVMRGLVCVLMAIDHVRVYSGLPAGGPTPGIFFTRWITHFVAPAFCFFAGTGAFLHGRKLGDMRALSRYLVVRGLILVFLELTVIRMAWTFNFDFAHYNLAGVIWMLGWCMVLLGALVRFPAKSVGIFGLVVMLLQQLVGAVGSSLPESLQHWMGWLFSLLYLGGGIDIGSGGPPLLIPYVIVPWIGVMAAGYGFGPFMLRDPAERRRILLRIGLGATALFLVAGSIVTFRRAPGEGAPPALFRLLGQQKYPASQLFLLMTLGPTIALLPFAENARGWFGRMLETFGRVPMFYYLLHIPLIHLAAMVVSLLREGSVNAWLFANHPLNPGPQPPGYRWSLPLLYLVWAICVALLYPACRWYAGVRKRNPDSWLTYI